MRGPSGAHHLAVQFTPAARLEAHWLGFLGTNGGEVKVKSLERTVRIRLTRAQIMAVWNAATTAGDCGETGEAHQVFERVTVGATFIEGTAGEMECLALSVGGDAWHDAIPDVIDADCAPHLFALAVESSRACAERAAAKIRAALRES
jgi:hypothetical protein